MRDPKTKEQKETAADLGQTQTVASRTLASMHGKLFLPTKLLDTLIWTFGPFFLQKFERFCVGLVFHTTFTVFDLHLSHQSTVSLQ